MLAYHQMSVVSGISKKLHSCFIIKSSNSSEGIGSILGGVSFVFGPCFRFVSALARLLVLQPVARILFRLLALQLLALLGSATV